MEGIVAGSLSLQASVGHCSLSLVWGGLWGMSWDVVGWPVWLLPLLLIPHWGFLSRAFLGFGELASASSLRSSARAHIWSLSLSLSLSKASVC